jgi:hypothetical protein
VTSADGEHADPVTPITHAVRRRLDGLQADRPSELPLDELVGRIGRARERKTWRTSRKRDLTVFPERAVEEGRAAFSVEATAVIGALDAGLARVEHEWVRGHVKNRALRGSLDVGDGVVKVLGSEGLYVITLGASGWWGLAVAAPGAAVRLIAERAAPAGPTLRATHSARAALRGLLAPRAVNDGFDEGWRLEADVFRGGVEQLFEAEVRPGRNRRRMRTAFRDAFEQGAILLDQTMLEDGPTLSQNIYSLELVAWMRVTAILEEAAARPDRDSLDATLDDASTVLGVQLNLLTAARIVERALVRQGRATVENLTAGLQQRPGPPSALFAARPLREYGS